MAIIIEAIIPQRLINSRIDKNVYAAVEKVVVKEMDEIERLFNIPTSTWSSDSQPKWKKKLGRGFVIDGLVTTGDTPFAYVELGTRYRFRAMSRDFKAKTRPGSLSASQGAGSAAGWVKKPLPGIKARNFRDIVARRRFPKFTANVNAAIAAAITRP